MRILVTGAAGFLGYHLVGRLLADGHRVWGLDNFSTGSRDNIWPGVSMTTEDVEDLSGFVELGLDRIYHLACPASPPHYQRDPLATILTAFNGTHAALWAAEATRARLLITSTSEVYGDAQRSPQSEDYWGYVNPIGKRSCYDEGKRAAEALAVAWGISYPYTDVRIARVFNTYGPRMALDDGRAISNFVVQALRGEPLTVYGDGWQTRSFCYVDDTIDGLVRLMEHPKDPGPVNIGNPNEIPLLKLAQRVNAHVGGTNKIVHQPLPEDDPKHRCPDITKAEDLLGWHPKTPLNTGLAATIADFRARLKVEKKP